MNLSKIPELKEAILNLPIKEKNKLLLRLINKDSKLVEQLHFELLEDEFHLIQRNNIIKEKIDSQLKLAVRYVTKEKGMFKHRELLSQLRSCSGLINYHAAVTKDKPSELEMRLYLMLQTFEHFNSVYSTALESAYAYKHFEYQKKRIEMAQKLYDKLHEDLQYEYRQSLEQCIEYATKVGILD